MTADEFSAAGNAGQTTQARPREGSVELAAIQDDGRAIARMSFDFAAGYHGNDSPQAQAALERVRALDARPGARREGGLSHEEMMARLRGGDVARVPLTPELPDRGGLLSQAETMDRLRRADPSSRRAPRAGLSDQVADAVKRQLPKYR